MPTDSLKYLTLTYHRRKPPLDITYYNEVSSDLVTWNEGAGYIIESSPTDDGNGVTESVKFRATTPTNSASRLFLRIRLTMP